MYRLFLSVLVLFLFVPSGCEPIFNSGSDAPYTYRFDEQPEGWLALFSNYGVGREDDFELKSGYRSLPEPLDTDQTGYYLSGKNLSDDLNMFLKHRINDLEPETSYEIKFEVSFATNVPSDCVGVGGAPGESVTVHADASTTEPDRVVDDSREGGFYRLNLAEDYEGEVQSWYRETEIGDVANSRDCEEEQEYEIKTVSGGEQTVTTSEEGELWVLTGSRSGFEGATSLYYTEVKLLLIKSNSILS